jgi:echinoid
MISQFISKLMKPLFFLATRLHHLGVNMGYNMENSYSNSNNGGSVNSQDSLYQMKMSAAAGNPGNLISQHHQYVERQPSYGYDPLRDGGYGTVDLGDYATYPHLATTPSQQMIADDYHNQMMMGQQTPSRQDYCTDPYAAVHKPNKKRLDPHMGKQNSNFN